MKEALFYEPRPEQKVKCLLCNHGCLIADKDFGLCRVRQNIGGTLYTLNYGKLVASHVDPIEKKPLYHFLPGSLSYSIASLGCNFFCDFCQNWQISQVDQARRAGAREFHISAQDVVLEARRGGCKSIAYTYTEPTVYMEFAYDCAVLAKEQGLRNVFVTNGFMTEAVLRFIAPCLDAVNIDIKSFKAGFYTKHCKARLIPVLENIRLLRLMRIWTEVTTLIIPGENDTPDELKDLAEFLAVVDNSIPWHLTAFHPDYDLREKPVTPRALLEQGYRIGKKAGLKYIYLGNVAAPRRGDTFCPGCGAVLIKRDGFFSRSNSIQNGSCAACGAAVAGVWG